MNQPFSALEREPLLFALLCGRSSQSLTHVATVLSGHGGAKMALQCETCHWMKFCILSVIFLRGCPGLPLGHDEKFSSQCSNGCQWIALDVQKCCAPSRRAISYCLPANPVTNLDSANSVTNLESWKGIALSRSGASCDTLSPRKFQRHLEPNQVSMETFVFEPGQISSRAFVSKEGLLIQAQLWA